MVKKQISSQAKPVKKSRSAETAHLRADDGLLSKTRTPADFMGPDNLLNNPKCDTWRERFINTLLVWAKSPDALEMEQFCEEYNILRQRLWEWRRDFPDVKKAVNHAKILLASHRRVGCMRKKYDYTSCYYDIHLLDPKMIKVAAYHDERKQKIAVAESKTYIIDSSKPVRVISEEELKEKNESIK
jgi:hypothetical protein